MVARFHRPGKYSPEQVTNVTLFGLAKKHRFKSTGYANPLDEKTKYYMFETEKKQNIYYFKPAKDVAGEKNNLSLSYLGDYLAHINQKQEDKDAIFVIPLCQVIDNRNHFNTLVIKGNKAYIIEPRASNRKILNHYAIEPTFELIRTKMPGVIVENVFMEQQEFTNHTDCGAYQINYSLALADAPDVFSSADALQRSLRNSGTSPAIEHPLESRLGDDFIIMAASSNLDTILDPTKKQLKSAVVNISTSSAEKNNEDDCENFIDDPDNHKNTKLSPESGINDDWAGIEVISKENSSPIEKNNEQIKSTTTHSLHASSFEKFVLAGGDAAQDSKAAPAPASKNVRLNLLKAIGAIANYPADKNSNKDSFFKRIKHSRGQSKEALIELMSTILNENDDNKFNANLQKLIEVLFSYAYALKAGSDMLNYVLAALAILTDREADFYKQFEEYNLRLNTDSALESYNGDGILKKGFSDDILKKCFPEFFTKRTTGQTQQINEVINIGGFTIKISDSTLTDMSFIANHETDISFKLKKSAFGIACDKLSSKWETIISYVQDKRSSDDDIEFEKLNP